MSYKVHPRGFRLGIVFDWKYPIYMGPKNIQQWYIHRKIKDYFLSIFKNLILFPDDYDEKKVLLESVPGLRLIRYVTNNRNSLIKKFSVNLKRYKMLINYFRKIKQKLILFYFKEKFNLLWEKKSLIKRYIFFYCRILNRLKLLLLFFRKHVLTLKKNFFSLVSRRKKKKIETPFPKKIVIRNWKRASTFLRMKKFVYDLAVATRDLMHKDITFFWDLYQLRAIDYFIWKKRLQELKNKRLKTPVLLGHFAVLFSWRQIKIHIYYFHDLSNYKKYMFSWLGRKLKDSLVFLRKQLVKTNYQYYKLFLYAYNYYEFHWRVVLRRDDLRLLRVYNDTSKYFFNSHFFKLLVTSNHYYLLINYLRFLRIYEETFYKLHRRHNYIKRLYHLIPCLFFHGQFLMFDNYLLAHALSQEISRLRQFHANMMKHVWELISHCCESVGQFFLEGFQVILKGRLIPKRRQVPRKKIFRYLLGVINVSEVSAVVNEAKTMAICRSGKVSVRVLTQHKRTYFILPLKKRFHEFFLFDYHYERKRFIFRKVYRSFRKYWFFMYKTPMNSLFKVLKVVQKKSPYTYLAILANYQDRLRKYSTGFIWLRYKNVYNVNLYKMFFFFKVFLFIKYLKGKNKSTFSIFGSTVNSNVISLKKDLDLRLISYRSIAIYERAFLFLIKKALALRVNKYRIQFTLSGKNLILIR